MEHKNWMKAFFFFLLQRVYSEFCSSQGYNAHKEHALVGHVFATYQVTWPWGCVMKCEEDPRCCSFNYQDRNLPGSPYHTCEINRATRDTSGADFYQYRKGFTYYEREIASGLPVFPPTVGSQEKPGKSCRGILQSLGAASSGQYWIDPDESGPFKVYCDMKTDGGGWTLIKRTVLTSSTPVMSFTQVGDYRMISEQVENRIVNSDGLTKLKQDMGFDQLRFYCHQKSVERTFHIVTNNDTLGRDVVRSMVVKFSPQAKACDSFTSLPDDNSVLSRNCDKWGYKNGREANVWGTNYPGMHGKHRLYYKSAFWSKGKKKGYYSVFIPSPSYSCDSDFSLMSQGDTYEIYVR